jgi:hypothetical protein
MPARSDSAFTPELLICRCNKAIELETAKIDESGNPVHEECYVQKISAHTSAIQPTPIQGDPNREEKPIIEEVIEFLDSEVARPVDRFCPACGSRLECREATFFYQDRTWNVHLTNCVKCNRTNLIA